MALPHAHPGQPIDIRPMGSRLSNEKTIALFKSEQLEVIRLVLQAGKSLPPHSDTGEITIQCVEGRIDVTFDTKSHLLEAGQMLFLSRGVQHTVAALEDSSALVSIVLAK